jgi:predicted DNA-binding transcriptional regulator AlpA
MNTQPSDISPRALTEKQAAVYIGMSRSFLAQSRMTGKLANRTPAPDFIKIGRAVRYLKDDLDQWLESQHKLEHLGQTMTVDCLAMVHGSITPSPRKGYN